jgi:hypothetical protein
MEFVFRNFFDGLEGEDGCIIHEYVQSAELALDGFEDAAYVIYRGNISLHDDCLTAGCANLVRDVACAAGVASIVYRYGGAGSAQLFCNARANALRGTGDESNFSGEFLEVNESFFRGEII